MTGNDSRLQAEVRSHARRQTIKLISDIKTAMDGTVVPILKQMQTASDTAKEYGGRHFDKYSFLRRAKGAGNAMESIQLRAAYAAILEDIEPRELTAFAQGAIDSGDAVLADCIQRENFMRPRSPGVHEPDLPRSGTP